MTGLRRYVHIAFAVLGLLAFFVLSNLFGLIAGAFSFRSSLLGISFVDLLAMAISAGGAFLLWRNEKVFTFGIEVAEELRKVTWPTAEETRTATGVVIVMVLVFSLALGLFDFIWSGITNAIVHSLS
jgi:preprotein translocase subunit SecE